MSFVAIVHFLSREQEKTPLVWQILSENFPWPRAPGLILLQCITSYPFLHVLLWKCCQFSCSLHCKEFTQSTTRTYGGRQIANNSVFSPRLKKTRNCKLPVFPTKLSHKIEYNVLVRNWVNILGKFYSCLVELNYLLVHLAIQLAIMWQSALATNKFLKRSVTPVYKYRRISVLLSCHFNPFGNLKFSESFYLWKTFLTPGSTFD